MGSRHHTGEHHANSHEGQVAEDEAVGSIRDCGLRLGATQAARLCQRSLGERHIDRELVLVDDKLVGVIVEPARVAFRAMPWTSEALLPGRNDFGEGISVQNEIPE